MMSQEAAAARLSEEALAAIQAWAVKATDAPWVKADPDDRDWGFLVGPDGMPVANTAMNARIPRPHPQREPPEVEANAHLIAAVHPLLAEATRARQREAVLEAEVAALRQEVEQLEEAEFWRQQGALESKEWE